MSQREVVFIFQHAKISDWKFQTFTCYNTVLSIFTLKLKKKNVYIFCIVTLFAIIMAIFYNHDMKNIIINTEI